MKDGKNVDRELAEAIGRFEGEGGALPTGPHQGHGRKPEAPKQKALPRLLENPYVSGVGASIIFELGRHLLSRLQ